MNLRKLVGAGILLATLGTSTALFAGTPGLTGTHSGSYNFTAYLGVIPYGVTNNSYSWTINFDNDTVTVQDGKVQTLLFGTQNYKIIGDKTITEIGTTGTYLFSYKFQPQGPFSSPIFTFETVLDISQNGSGLTITSVDSDNNQILGAKSISQTIVPFAVELDWSGSTN